MGCMHRGPRENDGPENHLQNYHVNRMVIGTYASLPTKALGRQQIWARIYPHIAGV